MPWMYLLELDTAELADVCMHFDPGVCILIRCGPPYLLFIANSTMKLYYCKWILEMLAAQLQQRKWVSQMVGWANPDNTLPVPEQ